MDIPFKNEQELSEYLQKECRLLEEDADKLSEVLFEAYSLSQDEEEIIKSISFHIRAELHQNPEFIHVVAKFLEHSKLLFNS